MWGKTVPDFIRKSILLFFGAVGYFIKNPSIASFKKKKIKKEKSDWSHKCFFCHRRAIFLTFHFHSTAVFHTFTQSSINFVLNLFHYMITFRATSKSAYFFWMWKCICFHLVYFFSSCCNKKKVTPFVHMPVNFFKYLSLFLGWGEGWQRDKMKKSLTFHFLHRLDWMLTGFFL